MVAFLQNSGGMAVWLKRLVKDRGGWIEDTPVPWRHGKPRRPGRPGAIIRGLESFRPCAWKTAGLEDRFGSKTNKEDKEVFPLSWILSASFGVCKTGT